MIGTSCSRGRMVTYQETNLCEKASGRPRFSSVAVATHDRIASTGLLDGVITSIGMAR